MQLTNSDKILFWYDQHRRDLPWRAQIDVKANPYHVWLSEIMLQQTTVITVKSYFEYFLSRWPRIDALAAAPLDDVLHAWQGLGYYARARNLHKCANTIVSEYDGCIPEDEKELIKLPGIGPYTAAAIAAIAFGKKATPVDSNIERVLTQMILPKSKHRLYKLACTMTPDKRAGDYAQALMDIGSTICTPKNPSCNYCPLLGECKAKAKGIEGNIPRRLPKKNKPTRVAVIFWLINEKGEILLRRRREEGLLGGMIEVPSSDWQEGGLSVKKKLDEAPCNADWSILPGKVKHTFSHFHLELMVAIGRCIKPANLDGFWCELQDFDKYAFPTVMKKVIAHALKYQD